MVKTSFLKILLKPYPLFVMFAIAFWLYMVSENDMWYIFEKHIFAIITMVFGSFVAGSSPEGSASIAYPVFTLLLKIEPSIARNFAFAIQSFGMTAASIFILSMRIKLNWRYITYVLIGGVPGLILGTFWVVPLISPMVAKLFFVSLWLSFGLVLWWQNRDRKRIVLQDFLAFQRKDIVILISFGILGGVISSIFGTGINIFTFCLMAIYYGIDEKIAVPSSIIIMTIETVFGVFLHSFIIQDFQTEAKELWLACIPFVIIFAPLGSYFMSKLPRSSISNFITIILVIQFVGAYWVIKPSGIYLLMSLLSVCFGFLIFFSLNSNRRLK